MRFSIYSWSDAWVIFFKVSASRAVHQPSSLHSCHAPRWSLRPLTYRKPLQLVGHVYGVARNLTSPIL